MRVLFLQQQPCIRTLKYAVGLPGAIAGLQLGFACRGQTLSEFYGSGDDLFDRWWALSDLATDVRAAIKEFQPDLIHCHNLPDELTVLAQELTEGTIPVIHDVHDLQSLRSTPYEDGFPEPDDPLALERQAVEESAGLVAVSEEMRAELEARYRLPAAVAILPNYALLRDLPAELPPPDRRRDGPPRVVYQGTLSVNDGHYDLREAFAAILDAGLRLDVHPAREVPSYRAMADRNPGMTVHDTLDPAALLATLPRYDLGWAGFNAARNSAHLDTVLPNKVFEYLGCGLPVLTLDHRALSAFVTAEGVGVSLSSLDDLPEQVAALDLVALRTRVAHVRRRFTVEGAMDGIADLYEQVCS
jgi:glycosyltransferase involved in cell wall biosynthesis